MAWVRTLHTRVPCPRIADRLDQLKAQILLDDSTVFQRIVGFDGSLSTFWSNNITRSQRDILPISRFFCSHKLY